MASAPAPAPAALRVDGQRFVTADGARFRWRGITAFRLAEMIAHGREAEAIAYLDWARGQKITVVRVLAMARQLFELPPEEGLKALPRLLELASARELYVEVVALADTAGMTLNFEQHVQSVATIAAARRNALVEIANEPWHATQDPRLHDPAYVATLAALVPASVPVALGSIEGHDGYAAAGRYATWHSPRSNADDGWGHVLEIAGGAGFPERWRKPVIGDEPIGAAAEFSAGRRDNSPRRFAAAAAMTRLSGLEATFHYEGGLQARVPSGRELECFEAWSRALDALAGLPEGGVFLASADLAEVAGLPAGRAVHGRRFNDQVWLAVVDPKDPSQPVAWRDTWKEEERWSLPGVTLIRGRAGAPRSSG